MACLPSEPRNCRVADVAASGNVRQTFPRPAPSQGLARLTRRQPGLPAEPRAPRHRPSAPFARTRHDQRASNSAKPASTVTISLPCGVVVSAQVSASERKPAPTLPIASSVLSRSLVLRGEPTQSRHDQGIARDQGSDRSRQRLPIGDGAAACGSKGRVLGVECLAVRAYPCIPDEECCTRTK
jgi:hypothetical protein